jgi:L-rhamnose mutarotase
MENDRKQGYPVRPYNQPVKRYCQFIELNDDPAAIAEYVRRHSEKEAWPEIRAGIREVGILEMELYLLGNKAIMIVETPLDFDWDTAMQKLATLDRQADWEAYMSPLQQADPSATSAEKWQLMERFFYLYPDQKK